MIQAVPRLASDCRRRRATRGAAIRQLLAGVLLAVLASAGTAHARDMTGKASIGVLAATDGTPYLAFRYWRTHVAIELLGSWSSHNSNDLNPANSPNASDLRVGAGLLWRIGDQPRASLAVGLRPWLTYHSETQPAELLTRASVSHYGVELPLQAELFLTDNFAVQGAMGLLVQFGSTVARADTALAASAHDGSVLVTLGGGFAGGLGFGYYF